MGWDQWLVTPDCKQESGTVEGKCLVIHSQTWLIPTCPGFGPIFQVVQFPLQMLSDWRKWFGWVCGTTSMQRLERKPNVAVKISVRSAHIWWKNLVSSFSLIFGQQVSCRQPTRIPKNIGLIRFDVWPLSSLSITIDRKAWGADLWGKGTWSSWLEIAIKNSGSIKFIFLITDSKLFNLSR